MDRKRLLGLADLEGPALRRQCVLERNAIVISELLGCRWSTAARQIGRAGADDPPDDPDFLGNKTEIVELPNAQPDVDVILDHVQTTIGKQHAYIDARI